MSSYYSYYQKPQKARSQRIFGFYFAAFSAFVSIAAAIVYAVFYGQSQYFDGWAVALPLVGFALLLTLGNFKATAAFAPIVLFAVNFGALLVYVHAVYPYLGEAFYSGVTIEAIFNLSPAFVLTFLLYLIGCALCNASAWMPQRKTVMPREYW